MNLEKEIQLFEEWCDIFGLPTDKVDDEYTDPRTTIAFLAWYQVVTRKGYKMVPVEISWQKADDISCDEWESKVRGLFISQNRDLTANQVEEFRLRWCKNRAHQIMREYKAMIGAVE